MQIRMIVVEDETAILQGLTKMIESMNLPLEIVGSFYDGQSALDSLSRTRPHIILTDVQMPGMTGLELIDSARKMDCEAEYLILSGYSDFAYARDALRLGVNNYLLKPPSHSELRDALEQLCEKVRVNYKARTKAELQASLLRQDMEAGAQRSVERAWLITWASSPLMDIPADLPLPGKTMTSDSALAALRSKGMLTDDVWVLDGLVPGSGHVAMLSEENVPNYRAVVDTLDDYARQEGIPLTWALNENPVTTTRLYQAASEHLAWIRQQAHFGSTRVLMDARHVRRHFTNTARDHLLDSLARVDEMIAQLKDMLDYWQRDDAILQDYLEVSQWLLAEMQRKTGKFDSTYCKLFGLQETAEMAMISKDAEDFSARLILRLRMIANHEETTQQELADVVSLLRETIEKDYCQPLDFNVFAAQHGYNAIYLRGKFSDLQGISPKKLMNRLRMEKACRLLRTTHASIGDVAQAVGYQDVAYFSRVFRDYTGISPREYRRNSRPGHDDTDKT